MGITVPWDTFIIRILNAKSGCTNVLSLNGYSTIEVNITTSDGQKYLISAV